MITLCYCLCIKHSPAKCGCILTSPPHPIRAQALIAIPGLARELSAMEASRVRIQPLLRLLADTLAARLLTSLLAPTPASASSAGDDAEAALLDLAKVGLLQQHAQSLAEALLHAVAAADVATPPATTAAPATKKGKAAAAVPTLIPGRESAKRILQALERRHPTAVDAAINSILRRPTPPASASGGAAPVEASSDEDEEDASRSALTTAITKAA